MGRGRSGGRFPARFLAALAFGAAAWAGSASGQGIAVGTAFAPKDESVEDLPAGPGRDETFGLCAACHAYRLVSNQGLTREKWDETLSYMTERHNMPDLQGEDRTLILDYLAKAHPPKPAGRAAGTFRNPFATQ